MSRLIKILAMTLVLTAILAVSITGTVFAAGGNPDNGNQGKECPYGDCENCDCENCICENGDCENADCEQNEYAYNHSYSYASPGPHGTQNMWQKGKVTE